MWPGTEIQITVVPTSYRVVYVDNANKDVYIFYVG